MQHINQGLPEKKSETKVECAWPGIESKVIHDMWTCWRLTLKQHTQRTECSESEREEKGGKETIWKHQSTWNGKTRTALASPARRSNLGCQLAYPSLAWPWSQQPVSSIEVASLISFGLLLLLLICNLHALTTLLGDSLPTEFCSVAISKGGSRTGSEATQTGIGLVGLWARSFWGALVALSRSTTLAVAQWSTLPTTKGRARKFTQSVPE